MKSYRMMPRALLLATTALTANMVAFAQDAQETGEVEEIVVEGTFIPDEKRATSEISNVLDETAFARTGDSDIAVSLTRVTGLSLVKGKFVYVRGLGERYSTALLDGANIPSPEPLQRAVPLDIFPTSFLEGALIQKTYSPEFPAEFGGGVIELRSKSIPDEPFFEFKIGTSYNTESSLVDGLSYDHPDLDILGFDSGLRSVPAGIVANRPADGFTPNHLQGLSPEEVETIAESIPTIFSLDNELNAPNSSFSFNGGTVWDYGSEGRLGVTAAVTYSNDFTNRFGIRRTFAAPSLIPRGQFDEAACSDINFPGNDGNCGFRSTENTVQLNGIFTAGWEINSQHSIKYTNMLLRKTTREGFNRQGQFAEQGILRNNTRIDFVEQQLWNQMISGEHYFNIFGDDALDAQLDWRFRYAETFRDVQLRREFRYNFDENVAAANPQTGGFIFDTSDEGNRTVWGGLEDEDIEAGFDFIQPFTFFDKPVDFKMGAFYRDTDRISNFLRFRYRFPAGTTTEFRQLVPEIIFGPANVGPGQIVFTDDVSRLEDAYTAAIENYGGYIQFDAQVTDLVRLSFGGRYDDAEISTLSFDVIGNPAPGLEETERFLPAGTLTYEFADNMQIRGAYSKTLTRPSLREISAARFLDDERDIDVRGNPDLITTELDNYDLRFEWYFGSGESFTVGAFYKQIQNPIEQVFLVEADEFVLSYTNGTDGELWGLEADLQTYLPWSDWFEGEFFEDRDFFFNVNATYIDASVNIDLQADNRIRVTDANHRLQGQSEWLGNVQIGWENLETGENVALLFNYTGDRISDLGVDGAGNIIEDDFIGLDFVYRRTFDTFGVPLQVGFSVRNILGDDLKRIQENRAGGEDQIVEQFDIGPTFGLSLGYSF